ncbi:Pkinase-domain-containing protein [Schizophyllum commune H4-8]|uniref:Pkinase-domain-containing protein n=1 Tax=Schizophyllum commune (strain H4-8 / FGSC 9210) TaxID=578458 RepID=UPI00215F7462|nr:Pkinase-domain-containing protein [Schizophyllum commune H4-8]KAI5899817.1 Pkinase-domain-containing protein [Schizophyllum commune H4-8]
MRSPISSTHYRLASDDDVVLPFLASANSNATLYDASASPGGYFTYTLPAQDGHQRSDSDMSIVCDGTRPSSSCSSPRQKRYSGAPRRSLSCPSSPSQNRTVRRPSSPRSEVSIPEVDPFDQSFAQALEPTRNVSYHLSPKNHLLDADDIDDAEIEELPSPALTPSSCYNLLGHLHCARFSENHRLNAHFVHEYQLEDELGSGGYGFVMTARHRKRGEEVAVKFIIKSKVPSYAWMQHEEVGQLPTEVMLLCFLDHPNIVKCKDLFEDSLYYYLVQELHGSPWQKETRLCARSSPKASATLSPLPGLCASSSHDSIPSSSSSSPATPFQSTMDLASVALLQEPPPFSPETKDDKTEEVILIPDPHLLQPARPTQRRRPSHDLFECIESSKHKRLPEDRARYVFAQVVDAVHYLDSQGVAHRDIKDENILIDSEYRVKLVDFGSASVIDPSQPRPFYSQFYGTTAYAASEILKKQKYQAAPAEVWTLGVLLSFLLTGNSPFPTVKEAVEGEIRLVDVPGLTLGEDVRDLLRRCLDPDPKTRATIADVKAHPWVTGEQDISTA